MELRCSLCRVKVDKHHEGTIEKTSESEVSPVMGDSYGTNRAVASAHLSTSVPMHRSDIDSETSSQVRTPPSWRSARSHMVGVAHMQRHFEPPSLAISLRPPRYLRSCNISNAILKVRPTKGVVRSTERGTIKINDLLNAKKDFGRKKCDCSELFGINLTKYRNMARQYFHLGTAFLNHLGTDC